MWGGDRKDVDEWSKEFQFGKMKRLWRSVAQ